MRVSKEQVAKNRRAILAVSGRLFRDRGFDNVTVAEVMNAAGLTHGGFYGYFESKDDLIAETLIEILRLGNGKIDYATFLDRYLSPSHRECASTGCVFAALAGDVVRQSEQARSALTAGLKHQIDTMGGADPAQRHAAIGTWSTLVGALTLSRMASGDQSFSAEILSATREWLRDPHPVQGL